MNEHEIKDREKIIVLDMLRAAKMLTEAHSRLLMRHFNDAKKSLRDLIRLARDVHDLIPKEEGE